MKGSLFAVAAAITAAVGAPAAHAAGVAGAVTGAPTSRGASATIVLAVDPARNVVTGASPLRAARVFRLALPARPHVLVARVFDFAAARGYVGVSKLFSAKRAQIVNVAVRPVGARAPAGRSPAGSTASRAIALTVKEIPLSVGGQRIGDAGPMLITSLIEPLDDCGASVVDTSRAFLEARAREMELQRKGLTDPSTRLNFQPIRHTHAVVGSATAARDGRITLRVRVVDSRTGKVVATGTASGRIGAELDAALAELAGKIAAALCPFELTVDTSLDLSVSAAGFGLSEHTTYHVLVTKLLVQAPFPRTQALQVSGYSSSGNFDPPGGGASCMWTGTAARPSERFAVTGVDVTDDGIALVITPGNLEEEKTSTCSTEIGTFTGVGEGSLFDVAWDALYHAGISARGYRVDGFAPVSGEKGVLQRRYDRSTNVPVYGGQGTLTVTEHTTFTLRPAARG